MNNGRRRHSRRRRIFLAYIMRTVAVCICAVMIFLMICGCLYLRDLFKGKKGEAHSQSNSVTVIDNKSDDLENKDETTGDLPDETGKNNENITIILDAGHGGNDIGTSSGTVKEKAVTLSVVKKMKEILEERGATVILIRDSDKYLSLEQRVEIANQTPADLFISIHCNYYEKDSSIKGMECYYCEASSEGKRYAENILHAVQQNGGIATRNVKPETFWVITKTNAPAVLIELGYLSNSSDRKNLGNEDYQDQLASVLSESILDLF